MSKHICIAALAMLTIVSNATAQTKIKDGTITGSVMPNTDAIMELESSNKGLLLPRVALDSTSLAAPLTAHIAGMTVYNIANTADVVPGYYYNDGSAWVRLSAGDSEPWNVQLSTSAANANTQNIYQMGSVSIGKDSAIAGTMLDVAGAVRGGTAASGTVGANSIAIGDSVTASGENATAFGWHHIASGLNAMVWGGQPTHGTVDSGRYNIASGVAATSWGYGNRASSWGTTTWGQGNKASNPQATAFGASNESSGFWSTSFGQRNVASGNNSLAFGTDNKAIGNSTLAFGRNNSAEGTESMVFGRNDKAKGVLSVAFGYQNIAASVYETVYGRFNADTSSTNINGWVGTDGLLQIGNGSSATIRTNAMTVLKNGKVAIGTHSAKPALSLEINGTDGMKVPSGTSAERPATPTPGTLRYNTTLGRPEMYVDDLNSDGTLDDAGWLKL